MKLVQLCGLALLLGACAVQPTAPNNSRAPTAADGAGPLTRSCDFDEIDGETFRFRPAEPGLQHAGYPAWQVHPEQPGPVQTYAEYADRLAKLQPEIDSTGFKWGHFVAVMDDCSKVYARRASQTETPQALERRAGIYFLETYGEVGERLGQTLWLKRWTGTARSRRLITPDPATYYPWRTFEEVKLVGIEPTLYAHAPGEGPFMVEVQLSSGGRALLYWNENYFTPDNPIAAHWSQATLASIQHGRLTVGMPADAVLASWGEPLLVNRRPTGGIELEQWVYRTGYAYIRDGHLQSSSTER